MTFLRFALVILSIVVLFLLTVSSLPTVSTDVDTAERALTGRDGKAIKYYKAFISYRRSTSKHLAWLIKILLGERNVQAFLDVQDLQAGYWDVQLKDAIRSSPNFIFILSNGTLDRCIGDFNYTDVVHQEIKAAIDTKRNIIPIFDDFTLPAVKFSPEIDEMLRFQGVEWNHSLIDGTIKRLIGYLRDTPLTNLTYTQ